MSATAPLRLPDRHGLTILVVDDNDDAVEILSTFLKVCGAKVLIARSGMAAFGYVTNTTFLHEASATAVRVVASCQQIRQTTPR